MNGFIVMPSIVNVRNACTERCDMFEGPCACGAWHHEKDWPDRIQEIVKFELNKLELI
jgi:hypothetical protein